MALTKVGKEGINGISNSSDANAITIDSSEKVGIGDTSPLGNKVHIRTAGSATSVNGDAGLVLESDDSTRCDLQFMGPDGAFQSIYFGDVSDDNRGIIAYSHSGNNMRFTVDASERMRLTSDGLTFNGDTAAANALNDYEEGTWTPSVRGSTTNGSFSGSNTVGFYTKIGDTVHAWFDCDGTISGAAGIIVFTGLPYASISTVEAVGQFMFDNLNVDGTRTNFVLYLGGNSTEMNIFESKDDASWTQVSISNEAIGIRGQITYKTA